MTQGAGSASHVGGQGTQPGSTHTPSPSVQLIGFGWSPYRLVRGRRCARRHRHKVQIVRTPWTPAVLPWGRRHPTVCSVGDEAPLVIGSHAAELSNLLGMRRSTGR